MGWLSVSVILFFSMVVATPTPTTPMVHSIAQGPKEVEDWFQNLSHKKEKVTKLHFFFHDTLSGKNPTAVQVAKANMTFTSPTFFGLVNVLDDPLTVGHEPNSTTLGRAQGFYGSAGMEQLGLIMTMNFVFTTGKYEGSTLSVLARNPALEKYREMPIVGGSGVFQLPRGIGTASTIWINLTTGDAVVEYNVVIIHY